VFTWNHSVYWLQFTGVKWGWKSVDGVRCSSYDQYSVCMKTVISHCSVGDQLTHAGLDNAYQYLCTDSTTNGARPQFFLVYWHCHVVNAQQGICNGTASVSVCPSVSLSSCSSKRSALTQPNRWHPSTALSSKCGQCHVYSQRTRLNMDLLYYVVP